MGTRSDNPGPALDPLTLDPNEEAGLTPPPPTPAVTGLTPDGRLRSGRLAGLSMNRAIWVLSWPILAESFLSSLVGLTDTVLAAQLSQAATDAIGPAAYFLWFVGLIAMAVGIGATALVSRAVGGGRWAVAHAATSQAVVLAALSGIFTAMLLAATAPLGASMVGLEGEARRGFITYLVIVSLGVPALSLLSAGIACARGAGDSVRPLMAMIAVNAVNIVVSWGLAGRDYTVVRWVNGVAERRVVLDNPSSLDWGVAGIAWGTVLGEWVGALVVLAILGRGWSGVRILAHRLKPHWHTIRRLVRVAAPNFLEMLGMWFGNFLILLLVSLIQRQQGEGVMGAHIVAIRIEAFSFLPGFAMGTAAAALAGQFMGAGSPRLARRAVLRCTAVATVFMGAAGLAFMLWPRQITGLVSGQPSHLELVPRLIFITGMVQIPFAVSNVLRSTLRGVGDARAVMTLVWVCTYAVRLPLAALLAGVDVHIPGIGTIENPIFDEPSLPMLWVALCSEIVIRGVLFAGRFLQGRWMTARV